MRVPACLPACLCDCVEYAQHFIELFKILFCSTLPAEDRPIAYKWHEFTSPFNF